jgi:hypothetical protein
MDRNFQRNAMLPEKSISLQRYIGRYLLHWVVTQANVWFLVYRCVDSVAKVHGPLDESLRILNQLLQAEEGDVDSDEEAENNENGPLDWIFRSSSYVWSLVRRTG